MVVGTSEKKEAGDTEKPAHFFVCIQRRNRAHQHGAQLIQLFVQNIKGTEFPPNVIIINFSYMQRLTRLCSRCSLIAIMHVQSSHIVTRPCFSEGDQEPTLSSLTIVSSWNDSPAPPTPTSQLASCLAAHSCATHTSFIFPLGHAGADFDHPD